MLLNLTQEVDTTTAMASSGMKTWGVWGTRVSGSWGQMGGMIGVEGAGVVVGVLPAE